MIQLMEAKFVIKVIVLSSFISVLIKLLSQLIEISPSNVLAITMVLTPTVVLSIVLWRRFLQSEV